MIGAMEPVEPSIAVTPIPPDVRRFLESMRVPCVLSTLRHDGHPITSSTWYGFSPEGDVIVATPAERNKAKNVRRDGRISILVDTREQPYCGVAIEGVADVVTDPGGALLQAIVGRYLGAEEAAAMLGRLGEANERVIIRLVPQRVRRWGMPSIRL
jgi:PPOX class probable F420-dependent enzyme